VKLGFLGGEVWTEGALGANFEDTGLDLNKETNLLPVGDGGAEVSLLLGSRFSSGPGANTQGVTWSTGPVFEFTITGARLDADGDATLLLRVSLPVVLVVLRLADVLQRAGAG
jgi:hypothetical protein